jgi:hypothetical protein
LPVAEGGEFVAAGFVVDPVRGRRRRLREHGPVSVCDEVALGHPAVALDGLEHLPGGASHRDVVRVLLVVDVDGVQNLEAGLNLFRRQIGGAH